MVMQKTKLSRIFGAFFLIGAFTFGGGYGMIPIIRQEIITKKQWLTEDEFCDILGVTQSAPGALAINMSIYIGYRLAGFWGAVVAAGGVTLPAFLVILSIATVFSKFSENKIVQKVFMGIRPAVVALIGFAGLKLAQTALSDWFSYILAGAVFLLQFVFKMSPVTAILLAAFTGYLYYKFLKGQA